MGISNPRPLTYILPWPHVQTAPLCLVLSSWFYTVLSWDQSCCLYHGLAGVSSSVYSACSAVLRAGVYTICSAGIRAGVYTVCSAGVSIDVYTVCSTGARASVYTVAHSVG